MRSFLSAAEIVNVDSVNTPTAAADTDSDAAGDDDDDSEDDKSVHAEAVLLADTFSLECRVTLLANVTTSSRNLAGDPRGPPESLV